jgi:hypothetical protein
MGNRIMLCLLFSFVNIIIVYGQTENSYGRKARPTEVSACIGGAAFFSVGLERYITNLLEININAGYGLSAGMNFHILDIKKTGKWSPYGGAAVTTFKSSGVAGFGQDSDRERIIGLYTPAGVKYIGRHGFTFSFEAAIYTTFWEDGGVGPWLGIKTGYRFTK